MNVGKCSFQGSNHVDTSQVKILDLLHCNVNIQGDEGMLWQEKQLQGIRHSWKVYNRKGDHRSNFMFSMCE